jgi:hypothetical protein
VQSQRFVKYSIISIVTLLILYVLIDQIFIRGRLVETYHGEVITAWDNTDIRGRNKPNIYQASVHLGDGVIVNIVCQRPCIVGQKIKVVKFRPLVGWTENYYSGI